MPGAKHAACVDAIDTDEKAIAAAVESRARAAP